jgi:hypothetical protein
MNERIHAFNCGRLEWLPSFAVNNRCWQYFRQLEEDLKR